MRQLSILFILSILSLSASAQNVHIPKSMAEDRDGTMSEAYWNIWNPDVQARIDADIDRYRKADAIVYIPEAKKGTPVKVEQLTSSFYFGSNIFNFDQLGSTELNNKYKDVFGHLLNSATVPFYWKFFEPECGHLRFEEGEEDKEEFWNNSEKPYEHFMWRRPPTEKIIRFLKEKGLRIHGHALMYPADYVWPDWVWDVAVPDEERSAFNYVKEHYKDMSADSISILLPKTADNLVKLNDRRIKEIAERYYDIVDSWDVVNETRTDYEYNLLQPEKALCKSDRFKFIVPGDYVYQAFQSAQRYLSPRAWLNINDNVSSVKPPCKPESIDAYAYEVNALRGRGCKIDVIGSQMHLFFPQQSLDISQGAKIQTPEIIYGIHEHLGKSGLPIHMSEITVTSPVTSDSKGEMIQAIIVRNLYRIWFSIEKATGITWWNLVDDCGLPGDPNTSGIFHRDMTPKLAYYALEELILNEWRTNLEVKVGEGGNVFFRGFKGKYRISWNDGNGEHERFIEIR